MKSKLGRLLCVFGLAVILTSCGSKNTDIEDDKQVQTEQNNEKKENKNVSAEKQNNEKKENKQVEGKGDYSLISGTWRLIDFINGGRKIPTSPNEESATYIRFDISNNGDLSIEQSVEDLYEVDVAHRLEKAEYSLDSNETEHHKLSDEVFSKEFSPNYFVDSNEIPSIKDFLIEIIKYVEKERNEPHLSEEDKQEMIEQSWIKDTDSVLNALKDDKEFPVYKYNFSKLRAIDSFEDTMSCIDGNCTVETSKTDKLIQAIAQYKENPKFNIINQTHNSVEYETTMRLTNTEIVRLIPLNKNYLLMTIPFQEGDFFTIFEKDIN